MKNKWGTYFLSSVAAILALTALAKLTSAFGSAKILTLPDPLLMLPNRLVLLGVGTIELTLVGIILFGRSLMTSTYSIAWFGSTLLIYRIGLWWTKPMAPCPCVGTITDALPISPAAIAFAMQFLLAYMIIGSYGILIYERLIRKCKSEIAQGIAKPHQIA